MSKLLPLDDGDQPSPPKTQFVRIDHIVLDKCRSCGRKAMWLKVTHPSDKVTVLVGVYCDACKPLHP